MRIWQTYNLHVAPQTILVLIICNIIFRKFPQIIQLRHRRTIVTCLNSNCVVCKFIVNTIAFVWMAKRLHCRTIIESNGIWSATTPTDSNIEAISDINTRIQPHQLPFSKYYEQTLTSRQRKRKKNKVETHAHTESYWNCQNELKLYVRHWKSQYVEVKKSEWGKAVLIFWFNISKNCIYGEKGTHFHQYYWMQLCSYNLLLSRLEFNVFA